MPSGTYTEGPYYKISTSSKGTIKVIDPTDYKYQGDNCLISQLSPWRIKLF